MTERGELKADEGIRTIKKDQDIEIMFHKLKYEDAVPLESLFKEIKSSGLMPEKDKRLREMYETSCEISNGYCFKDVKLGLLEFHRVIGKRKNLISNCLLRKLKIEEFSEFSNTIDSLYELQRSNISGQLSKEFPELGEVDTNKWGIAICSVDGQRKFAGDSSSPFTLQNLCKPLLLGLVLKTVGIEAVKKYLAFEPSNIGKDVVELNQKGKPLNSMVNTGAIMLCALLTAVAYKGKSVSHIHETYIEFVKRLLADEYLEFNASAYISKKESADELRCLSFGMSSSSTIPPECNIVTSLDLFLKASSIEVTVESLSIVAATLANGGINPFTEKEVLSPDNVKEILSAMYSYGLYQFSGESSFSIGLPMKSSVTGGLIMIVPERMGVALYSPMLNDNGISDRSYQFVKDLVKKMKLHHFDIIEESILKKFPNRREKSTICEPFCELLSAAASNDVTKLLSLQDKKADFYVTDFYGLTVLHVAAAKGAFEAIKFILDNYPSLVYVKDKWNRTPKAYALELKHNEIAKYLDTFDLSQSSNFDL